MIFKILLPFNLIDPFHLPSTMNNCTQETSILLDFFIKLAEFLLISYFCFGKLKKGFILCLAVSIAYSKRHPYKKCSPSGEI